MLRNPRRLIPLAILLALFAIGDWWAACFPIESYEHYVELGATIGLFFAQIAGLAVATSMLAVRSSIRITSGAIMCLLLAATIGLYMRSAPRTVIPLLFGGILVSQWIVYQIPLWNFRARGWSLSRGQLANSLENEGQFGLTQIFVWTTMAGIFLAIIRALGRHLSIMEASPHVTSVDWSLFAILTVGNAIIVLPIMWGAFVREHFAAWLVGSILWALIATPLQIHVLASCITLSSSDKRLFAIANAVQFWAVLLLLLSIRFYGLRLQRRTL